MEGSGVEFEANDGKDEDGKGDKEANLENKIYINERKKMKWIKKSRPIWKKKCDNILHTLCNFKHTVCNIKHSVSLTMQCKPVCRSVFLD